MLLLYARTSIAALIRCGPWTFRYRWTANATVLVLWMRFFDLDWPKTARTGEHIFTTRGKLGFITRALPAMAVSSSAFFGRGHM